MLILSESDISSILRPLKSDHAAYLLTTLSDALGAYSAQKSRSSDPPLIHQPHRTSIVTRDHNTTLFMPVSDTTSTAIKVVTIPRGGPVKGAVTIYAATGELVGVLNAAEITAFRTALTTMTLLTRCKRLRVRNVLVFGAGKQTEWHVRLALTFLTVGGAVGLNRITVVNRGRGRLQELEREVLDELRSSFSDIQFETIAQEGNEAYKQQLKERLGNADVICCCTPSTEPLFTASDLQNETKKSRFISLIGSYKPEMQEIDTETLRSADKVWVDSKEECLTESGELIRAKMQPEELAEIGELILQRPEAEVLSDDDPKLIIFKCVGLGIMDLAIGKALLKLAEKLGKGIKVEEF